MADSDDVVRLAALARIAVSKDEAESFALGSILDYVSMLEKIDVSTLKETTLPVQNVFRDDRDPHEEELHTEKIVELFPEREENLLVVKQILSHD